MKYIHIPSFFVATLRFYGIHKYFLVGKHLRRGGGRRSLRISPTPADPTRINERTCFAETNGEGGIRTLGTGLLPYSGLANRRFRPLSHLSRNLTAFGVQGSGCWACPEPPTPHPEPRWLLAVNYVWALTVHLRRSAAHSPARTSLTTTRRRLMRSLLVMSITDPHAPRLRSSAPKTTLAAPLSSSAPVHIAHGSCVM